MGTMKTLATTLAVQMLVSMAVLAVPVLAPAAAADVGVPATYVGLYIALVYGASMLSSLACGDLIRRLGAIRVSQLCLLACAAGALLAAGGTLPLMVASAAAMGIGYGPVTPASSHVLARTTAPGVMSFVFSVKQTGVPLGGALAGALVPALVLGAGWKAALAVIAAACVLTALAAEPMRGVLDADREPGRGLGLGSLAGPLRVVAAAPDVRRLAVMSFVYSSIQLCLLTYLVTYLTSSVGYDLVQAGLMLSIAQAAGVAARIGWGAVADRTGRPVLLLSLLGVTMAGAALATAAFMPDWPAVLVALVCAVFGGSAIGWNGVYLAEVARRAPPGRAVEATGGAVAVTYFGVLVSPPLFALAVQQGAGYGAPYAVLALPALAIAAHLWLWQRAMGRIHPQ
jgi:MFS family permease